MLNFEEFKGKLTSIEKGPDWLHAYVDRSGSFWIQGYGGMGTTIFKKLDGAHPFLGYLKTLRKDDIFEQQSFKYEYEAGEELARLLPNITADPDVVFEDLDKAGESGDLFRAIGKVEAKGILSHIKADESVSEDESILSAVGDDARAENVFDLLNLDDEHANELMDKANLMIRLRDKYMDGGQSKSEFAQQIGLDDNEMNSLLDGDIEAFTMNALEACLKKFS